MWWKLDFLPWDRCKNKQRPNAVINTAEISPPSCCWDQLLSFASIRSTWNIWISLIVIIWAHHQTLTKEPRTVVFSFEMAWEMGHFGLFDLSSVSVHDDPSYHTALLFALLLINRSWLIHGGYRPVKSGFCSRAERKWSSIRPGRVDGLEQHSKDFFSSFLFPSFYGDRNLNDAKRTRKEEEHRIKKNRDGSTRPSEPVGLSLSL